MKVNISILTSLILTTSLFSYDINIKEGWQLKGSERGFSDMSLFDNSCIDVIYTFDDKFKSWKVYGENSTEYPMIRDIRQDEGFWVMANSSCTINNSSENNITDKYRLKSGWQILGTENEISSMEIFNSSCINSLYTYNNGWSVYYPDDSENSSQSTLTSIEANSGFWIKANSECDIQKSTTNTQPDTTPTTPNVVDNSQSDTNTTSSTVGTTGFYVTSKALKSKNILPLSYTCDGVNSKGEHGGVSPTLTFENVPEGTKSFAVTMHILKGDGDKKELEVLWVLYDIPSSTTTIEQTDPDVTPAGIMGISERGANEYFPPCSKGVKYNAYTITAYALPNLLGISKESATYDVITTEAQKVALDSATLVVSNVRYNPDDEAQLFVPTKTPSTCEEKSKAFEAYDTTKVVCDETNNKMSVISKTGVPERSQLDVDKLNVGTEAWIGRVPLTRESTWTFPIEPTYLNEPTNDLNIHHPIGITVDGIPIIHYAKESEPNEIVDLNADYSDRDTVLLGELDQCGGHAGNGEDYHYHYAPLCMMDTHDPSTPLAYMFDGIPLYFGTSGGNVTELGGKTKVNYGGGRYSNLNFLPSDVRSGENPLDKCNAYDINGDGATSGYVYYTTKEFPYTIGCFRGEANQENSIAKPVHWEEERDISWSGSDVLLSDYDKLTFNNKEYFFIEITPGETNNKIASGNKGQILYRKLDTSENGYQNGLACWEFRYRLDKNDTDGANDTVAIHCREE